MADYEIEYDMGLDKYWVIKGGKYYENFKDEKSAQRYIDRLSGKKQDEQRSGRRSQKDQLEELLKDKEF